MPRLHHRFILNLWPSMVNAAKHKNKLIEEGLRNAWNKFSEGQDLKDDGKVKCALDLLVQREAITAKKQGRPAKTDTQDMRDELFGFLVAGHEVRARLESY